MRLDLALKPLMDMYGSDPASEFSPLKLKAVRQSMISKLCRSEVNARTQIVRQVFRWATSEELVSAVLYHGLQSVEHLRAGEFGVREGKTREPVDEDTVRATLPYLHPVASAMVKLLWWTGARPSEVFNLCPKDIDRSGNVWVAQLLDHKTVRKGKTRELGFGPKAQAVLRRYLDRVPPPARDKPLFSPKMAMAEHRHQLRQHRRTPVSHEQRLDRERAQREVAKLGDRYNAGVLRNAIRRAVVRCNQDRKKQNAKGQQPELPMLEIWTPYQLRHAALTRIRNAQGLEAAKAVGGHATAVMSEGYTVQAERELARRVAGELG